jgi:hypothetical protein
MWHGIEVPIDLMMLLAFALAPQSTPDSSGLWRLNLRRSTFRSQAPRELLVKIQHREPTVVQWPGL